MPKPKPETQNVQIKGETLVKMDTLRDAANKQGSKKSYPDVVADAVNLFYDVSCGARSSRTRDEVAEERAVALGISCMNILTAVIQSGQNVKECECIARPGVDAIGIITAERIHNPDAGNGHRPLKGVLPHAGYAHTVRYSQAGSRGGWADLYH